MIGVSLFIGYTAANYLGQDQDRQHAGMNQVERINALLRYVYTEASANPSLYDYRDLQEFLQGEGGSYALKFLNQRSNHVGRAFKLAWQTLRWRHKMGIRDLSAADFPCDLFEMGLIFESGVAHHMDPTIGRYVEDNPVIWIRLGALGSTVKEKKEKLTTKRMWSSVYHSVITTKNSIQKTFRRSQSSGNLPQATENRPPMIESMSVKDDITIQHINRAIAWWLEDWRQKHGPDAKATLVLDFENTDFAFSSWTMGEFLISLDDYFPDMFDQIIGFRYKPHMYSLHSRISMFNRIFKSRFAASPETDRKLKFVSEQQISSYMPRVDAQGVSMLPHHVAGYCGGPRYQPPAGCQADLSQLAAAGIIDPEMWAAVYNEFYQICKPLPRPA